MPQLSAWPADGLHAKLCEILPTYRTRRGALDVPRLGRELCKSEEAIYRWFRANNLKSSYNARDIIELANTPDNLDALVTNGGRPPRLEDLIRFY